VRLPADNTIIAVRQKLPTPVPLDADGASFEVDCKGQFRAIFFTPNIRDNELASFKEGFRGYSVFSTNRLGVTLLFIAFKFDAPVGYMETPFHAARYPDDRMELFLKSLKSRRYPNMVS
jgi:hypothetical protein